jgi:hypothetical protein
MHTVAWERMLSLWLESLPPELGLAARMLPFCKGFDPRTAVMGRGVLNPMWKKQQHSERLDLYVFSPVSVDFTSGASCQRTGLPQSGGL